MKSRKRTLLDTNVLVYATLPTAPQHRAAYAVCADALAGDPQYCVTPQILIEYYATLTNPKRVDPVRTSAEAQAALDRYRTIHLLHPTPEVFDEWVQLITMLGATGQDVFDLLLAATMLVHEVTDILTYDARMFAQVPGLTVRKP